MLDDYEFSGDPLRSDISPTKWCSNYANFCLSSEAGALASHARHARRGVSHKWGRPIYPIEQQLQLVFVFSTKQLLLSVFAFASVTSTFTS